MVSACTTRPHTRTYMFPPPRPLPGLPPTLAPHLTISFSLPSSELYSCASRAVYARAMRGKSEDRHAWRGQREEGRPEGVIAGPKAPGPPYLFTSTSRPGQVHRLVSSLQQDRGCPARHTGRYLQRDAAVAVPGGVPHALAGRLENIPPRCHYRVWLQCIACDQIMCYWS